MEDSIVDGPGLRTAIFAQGCPRRCEGCHNPESWAFGTGTDMTVQDLFWRVKKNPLVRGVTLSGGEPLMQPEFAASILEGCRENGLHTAIDTAGSVSLFHCRRAVDQADLLLLDIKAARDELFRKITGRGMDNTLELLNHCENVRKPVWIRHVLVPGLTDGRDDLCALGVLLSRYACIERVELLPFHKMGEYKWEALAAPYTLKDTPAAGAEDVEQARRILKAYGLKVK